MFSFYFAALGEPFCSKAERADFDAVLGERLSTVSGGALEVARVRETIDDTASCWTPRQARALTRGRCSMCRA